MNPPEQRPLPGWWRVELDADGPVELLGHGRLDGEPAGPLTLPRELEPSPAAVLRFPAADA